MSPQRLLLVSVSVVTALLLQTTVLTRLPLPGAAPDLVLVVVIAFALAGGPLPGSATGFAAGCLADLLSDHELGRLALAYAVAGYLAGWFADDSERSTLVPFLVVGGASAAALTIYGMEGVLLGDPRVTITALGRSLASTVPYDVVLTPFVVPAVGALSRRVDGDPLRR